MRNHLTSFAFSFEELPPGEILNQLKMIYNCSTISKIEKITRNQTNSLQWHEFRKGIVTASIAKSCFTKIKTMNKLIGPVHLKFS